MATQSYRRKTTLTLHVVETVEHGCPDDETPSLSGMPVVETDGEDVTPPSQPELAECGPVEDAATPGEGL